MALSVPIADTVYKAMLDGTLKTFYPFWDSLKADASNLNNGYAYAIGNPAAVTPLVAPHGGNPHPVVVVPAGTNLAHRHYIDIPTMWDVGVAGANAGEAVAMFNWVNKRIEELQYVDAHLCRTILKNVNQRVLNMLQDNLEPGAPYRARKMITLIWTHYGPGSATVGDQQQIMRGELRHSPMKSEQRFWDWFSEFSRTAQHLGVNERDRWDMLRLPGNEVPLLPPRLMQHVHTITRYPGANDSYASFTNWVAGLDEADYLQGRIKKAADIPLVKEVKAKKEKPTKSDAKSDTKKESAAKETKDNKGMVGGCNDCVKGTTKKGQHHFNCCPRFCMACQTPDCKEHGKEFTRSTFKDNAAKLKKLTAEQDDYGREMGSGSKRVKADFCVDSLASRVTKKDSFYTNPLKKHGVAKDVQSSTQLSTQLQLAPVVLLPRSNYLSSPPGLPALKKRIEMSVSLGLPAPDDGKDVPTPNVTPTELPNRLGTVGSHKGVRALKRGGRTHARRTIVGAPSSVIGDIERAEIHPPHNSGKSSASHPPISVGREVAAPRDDPQASHVPAHVHRTNSSACPHAPHGWVDRALPEPNENDEMKILKEEKEESCVSRRDLDTVDCPRVSLATTSVENLASAEMDCESRMSLFGGARASPGFVRRGLAHSLVCALAVVARILTVAMERNTQPCAYLSHALISLPPRNPRVSPRQRRRIAVVAALTVWSKQLRDEEQRKEQYNGIFLDSGSDVHNTGNKSKLINFRKLSRPFRMLTATGERLVCRYIGDVDDVIKGVFYHPKFKSTLISTQELRKLDLEVTQPAPSRGLPFPQYVTRYDGTVVYVAREDGLILPLPPDIGPVATPLSTHAAAARVTVPGYAPNAIPDAVAYMHLAYNHAGEDMLCKIAEYNPMWNLSPTQIRKHYVPCLHCIRGKTTKHNTQMDPSYVPSTPCKKVGDIIVRDIYETPYIQQLSGHLKYETYVDMYSGYTILLPLQDPSTDVLSNFERVMQIFATHGHTLSVVRNDDDNLYNSAAMMELMRKAAIKVQASTPETFALGAERKHRVFNEKVTTMYDAAPYAPPILVSYALQHVVWTENLCPHAGNKLSSYELFTGLKPDNEKYPLLPWGCPVEVSIPSSYHVSKYATRTVTCLYLGVAQDFREGILTWNPYTAHILPRKQYRIPPDVPHEWIKRPSGFSLTEERLEDVIPLPLHTNADVYEVAQAEGLAPTVGAPFEFGEPPAYPHDPFFRGPHPGRGGRGGRADGRGGGRGGRGRGAGAEPDPYYFDPPPIGGGHQGPGRGAGRGGGRGDDDGGRGGRGRGRGGNQQQGVQHPQPLPQAPPVQLPPHPPAPAVQPTPANAATAAVPVPAAPVAVQPPLPTRVGTRHRQPPDYLGDFVHKVKQHTADNPTLKQALRPDNLDKAGWERAIIDELAQLDAQNVFSLVEKPLRSMYHNAIPCHFVLVKKWDADGNFVKYKARFVVDGNFQKPGTYDAIRSPTARSASFKLLLAIAAAKGLKTFTMDVKGAFTHSLVPPDVNLYIRMPDGKIARLNRYLYGLKQAGLEWNNLLVRTLKQFGFTQSETDPCLFVYDKNGEYMCTSVHVDDLMIAANSRALVTKLYCHLANAFGEVHLDDSPYLTYLGMSVQVREEGITLLQPKALAALFASVDFNRNKPAFTPYTIAEPQNPADLVDRIKYLSILGQVNYIAVNSRPELLNVLSILAQRSQQPNERDLFRLKRVIQYLHSTQHLGLHFHAHKPITLIGYVDSSHDSLEGSRSQTGYAFSIGVDNGSFFAKSTKQPIVTLSSTESEFVALCEASKELLWLRSLLEDMGFRQGKTILYEDNTSTITIAKGGGVHARTKHIDKRGNFVKQLIENGTLDVVYIPSADNIADILTKSLDPAHYTKLRDAMLRGKE